MFPKKLLKFISSCALVLALGLGLFIAPGINVRAEDNFFLTDDTSTSEEGQAEIFTGNEQGAPTAVLQNIVTSGVNPETGEWMATVSAHFNLYNVRDLDQVFMQQFLNPAYKSLLGREDVPEWQHDGFATAGELSYNPYYDLVHWQLEWYDLQSVNESEEDYVYALAEYQIVISEDFASHVDEAGLPRVFIDCTLYGVDHDGRVRLINVDIVADEFNGDNDLYRAGVDFGGQYWDGPGGKYGPGGNGAIPPPTGHAELPRQTSRTTPYKEKYTSTKSPGETARAIDAGRPNPTPYNPTRPTTSKTTTRAYGVVTNPSGGLPEFPGERYPYLPSKFTVKSVKTFPNGRPIPTSDIEPPRPYPEYNYSYNPPSDHSSASTASKTQAARPTDRPTTSRRTEAPVTSKSSPSVTQPKPPEEGGTAKPSERTTQTAQSGQTTTQQSTTMATEKKTEGASVIPGEKTSVKPGEKPSESVTKKTDKQDRPASETAKDSETAEEGMIADYEVTTEILLVGEKPDFEDNIKPFGKGDSLSLEDPKMDTKNPGSGIQKVRVTREDKSSKVINVPVVVIQPMTKLIQQGTKADFTDALKGVPAGATVTQIGAPVNSAKSTKGQKEVLLTLKDKSRRQISVDYYVFEVAPEIIELGQADVNLIDNIKNLPAGSKVELVDKREIDTSKPGKDSRKVKILTSDGSVALVDVPYEILGADGQRPVETSGDITLKVVCDNAQAKVGDKLNFKFEVTNNTSTKLENLRLTNDLLGAKNVLIANELAAGESMTYAYNTLYVVRDDHVEDGKLKSVSKLEAANDNGRRFLAEDTIEIAIEEQVKGDFLAEKIPSKQKLRKGEKVGFTYVITNTSPQPLKNISLTDPELGIDNRIIAGVLNPGDQISYTHDALYLPSTEQAQDGHAGEAATVTAIDGAGNEIVQSTKGNDVEIDNEDYGEPEINKGTTKEAYGENEPVDYYVEIKNTTPEPIFDIALTDTALGVYNLVIKDRLDPGQSFVYRHPNPYRPSEADKAAGEVKSRTTISYRDGIGAEKSVDLGEDRVILKKNARIFVEALEIDSDGKETGKTLKSAELVRENVGYGSDYEVEAPKIDGYVLKGVTEKSDPAIGKAEKESILVSFTYVKEVLKVKCNVVFRNTPDDFSKPDYVWLTVKDGKRESDYQIKRENQFEREFTVENEDFEIKPEKMKYFTNDVRGNRKDGITVYYVYDETQAEGKAGASATGLSTDNKTAVPATGEGSGAYCLAAGLLLLAALGVVIARKQASKQGA